MADIQYLNYGDQQIEQQAFLTKAANEVQNYVLNQPWSKKRKEKFMSAYSDLMNRGIQGASNSTGQWVVNVGGDSLNLDSMNSKDKEMYQEAAYFIQQQMQNIPVSEQKEDKSKLPIFDNKYFTSELHNKIGRDEFGGRDWDTQTDWNGLDKRGENGLRGKTQRAATLAKHLRQYSDSLEEGKFNFEGSPFSDLNDFKTRVNSAIEALSNPDDEDKLNTAFNHLGLKTSDYFNNGGGDLSDQVINGQRLSYAELAQYNAEQTKLQQEQDALKQQQAIKQKQIDKENKLNNSIYIKYRTSSKMSGKTLNQLKSKYQNNENLTAALQGFAQKGIINLTPEELLELHGAYKYGALDNVDDKTLKLLQNVSSGRYKGTSSNRFKKIRGIDNLIYDTAANQVMQLQTRDQVEADTIANKNIPTDIFKGVKTSEEKRIEAGNRKVNDGEWKAEDKTRMAAMAQDITGTVAALLPTYGTAVSAGLGLTALGTNMAADIMDSSVSKWDVVKNAGINLGLGLVGLIPGVGIAGKSGKWVAQVAKWAPRLLTMASAGQIALDDNIKKSIAKVSSNETLTVNDWKNIGYALSVAAGISRGVRGIVDNRKYNPAFKKPTKTETFITTKSGKKIPATKEQVDKINKAGRKSGNEKANEELRKLPGAENEEVNIEFKTGIKGKADFKNKIKLEETTSSISTSPRIQAYQRALQMQDKRRKSGQGIYKFAPRFFPTSYKIYSKAAKLQLPEWNITNKFKKAWNPISEGKTKKTSSSIENTQSSKNVQTNQQNNIPEETKIRKEIITEYKEYLKGNHTKDPIKPGTIKINNTDLSVKASNVKRKGQETFDLHFGKTHKYNLTQEQVKKQVFESVKQIRKQKDSSGKIIKKTPEEVGKILKDLKKKGLLKNGGKITKIYK